MRNVSRSSVVATRRDAIAIGALLTLGLVLFAGLEALRPGYFLWDDNATQNLPSYVYDWRAVTGADAGSAALPQINLHQYLGQIWLGNGQSGVLYPPVYLAAALAQALWGDLRPTVDLLAILHLLLGAAGFYWLLRGLSVSRPVAVIAGLLWATLPFHSQVGRNWIFVAYVAGLAPWNLGALLRLTAQPGLRPILGLAAIKALLFFSGHANFAVMVAVFDGVLLLALFACDRATRANAWHVVIRYAAALLLTGALAAPLLLPMLEAQQLSAHRSGRLSFAEFSSNPLRPWVFVKAQAFAMEPRAIHQASGSIFYFGIWNLGLLAWSLAPSLRRRRSTENTESTEPPAAAAGAETTGEPPRRPPSSHQARALGLAAIVAFALSTRAAAIFYPLPLLSSFRWPFKHYLFFLLFATVAAAMACDALSRSPAAARWRVALLGLFAWGVLVHLTILLNPAWDKPFGPYRIDRPVAELTQEIRATLGDADRGRVLSLWQTHREAGPEDLTHNYASLTGVRHLGGYDPLIAATNLELALRLDYSNIFRYLIDQNLLDYLSRWSVRFLVAPAREDVTERLSEWPQLEPRYRDARVQVWENTQALPLVRFDTGELEPVHAEWQVNGVDVFPNGASGNLRVALAPLPWWYVAIDGGNWSPASFDHARQMLIQVPPQATKIQIRYRNIPFRLGTAILAITILALIGVALRKHQTKTKPT